MLTLLVALMAALLVAVPVGVARRLEVALLTVGSC